MRICEQVVVVDEPRASSLGRVVAGLQAVEAERVLVVDASRELPAPEFVLALTAWPESPAVVPEMDSPACAIYVREAVLPDARARLESGETGLADWHSGCDACVLDAATLAAISEADG